MKKTEVSRRVAVGIIGAGAVGVAASVVAGGRRRLAWRGARAVRPVRGAAAPNATSARAGAAQRLSESLVTPLAPGSEIDRWRVERILPVENGAASVVLSDARGRSFQLDVCSRDRRAGAPTAPGRSELFEVFLANAGNGKKASFEEHGLAAMALAEVIRGNEQRVSRSSFLTLSERIARHGARVHLHLV